MLHACCTLYGSASQQIAVHTTYSKTQQVSRAVIIEWIISLVEQLLLSFQINLKYLHQQTYRHFSIQFQCERCSSLVHVNYGNAENDHEKCINYVENLLRYFEKHLFIQTVYSIFAHTHTHNIQVYA